MRTPTPQLEEDAYVTPEAARAALVLELPDGPNSLQIRSEAEEEKAGFVLRFVSCEQVHHAAVAMSCVLMVCRIGLRILGAREDMISDIRVVVGV